MAEHDAGHLPHKAFAMTQAGTPSDPRTGTAAPPADPGGTSRLRVLVPWIVGLMGFAALIMVVVHFGSLERMIALARAAHPAWLLLAVLAQAGTYVAAALVWRQVLRRAGHARSLKTLVPLGIAKLFTDQVLPSGGISGTMLVVRGLIRRRVPSEVAMAAMLAGLVSYDIAYLAVVLAAVGILRLNDRAGMTLYLGAAAFTVLTIAVPVGVLALKRWGDWRPIAWLARLLGLSAMFRALAKAPTDLLRSPLMLVETTGLQVAIFLLDGLTLWLAFVALGEVPPLWVVFVSFIIASTAATLGPVPVGLGTFEASSVAMLSFLGVSLEAALAATLLLRALTFWLPMIPGIWLARREIAEA
jgi:uncharacterized membrane protein YbhN (UPF0104 family)